MQTSSFYYRSSSASKARKRSIFADLNSAIFILTHIICAQNNISITLIRLFTIYDIYDLIEQTSYSEVAI